MSDQAGPRIQILSDPETIARIVQLMDSEGLRVISHGPVEDPGRLAFDFTVVANIVIVASGLFFDGPIVPRIWHSLRRANELPERDVPQLSKSVESSPTADGKIIIDGPGGRYMITAGENLSDTQVVALFRAAAGVRERES